MLGGDIGNKGLIFCSVEGLNSCCPEINFGLDLDSEILILNMPFTLFDITLIMTLPLLNLPHPDLDNYPYYQAGC